MNTKQTPTSRSERRFRPLLDDSCPLVPSVEENLNRLVVEMQERRPVLASKLGHGRDQVEIPRERGSASGGENGARWASTTNGEQLQYDLSHGERKHVRTLVTEVFTSKRVVLRGKPPAVERRAKKTAEPDRRLRRRF